MPKPKRKRTKKHVSTTPLASGNIGEFLTGLRRSAASGIHGKKSADRYNTNRKTIDREKNDGQDA